VNDRLPRAWGAGVLALLSFSLALLPPAAARADEAAPIYETGAVTVIDLTLSGTAKAELEAEPDEYVEGTFSAQLSDGTPGGTETPLTASPQTVGIRLKGSELGSFRPLSGKAAFKIKFKQFGGPKFLGLKKMTLNNMVEDPSMIHEALTYTAFRELGIPAPRTGYTFLRVNGQPYGVYLDIETVDDVALKRIFGSFDEETQHLYEAEYHTDVVPGGAGDYEVDEGDETNREDLEALIAAVNGSSPASFSARVASVADLEEMTLFWAIEKYIGRWDGYAGKAGAEQPNNYYLFSEPSGRFQMLPWGSDETWEERLAFDGHDGLMFNLCLEDSACATEYWEELKGARAAIAGLPLGQLATELSELLEPWQELDPRREVSMNGIGAAVAEVHDFIAERPAEAAAWLAAHEPPPSQPPRGEAAARPLRIAALGRRKDELRMRFVLDATGTLGVRVFTGGARICATRHAAPHGGGALVLYCRLPRSVRERLHRRALSFRVVAALSAEGEEAQTAVRRVRLPRD
jgi:CotH kinase protein